MRIVVLVKQVPDTWSDRRLDVRTGWVDRSIEPVVDEVGERALEAALTAQESSGAEVVVLSMGPRSAADAVKHALAMGADEGVHVLDDALAGADLVRTAQVLAAAIADIGFDLILGGNQSTDGRGGMVPAMIAEILGIPHATSLNSVAVSDGRISGERGTEYGTEDVVSDLPAVATVTERAPEARLPSFRGIMKAKKKPIRTVSVAELAVAGSGAASIVLSAAQHPPRESGVKVVDDGDSGRQLAEFLRSRHLV
jgi:electron transfer flavoprotein beta subunit